MMKQRKMRFLGSLVLMLLSTSILMAQSHKGFRWIGKAHELYTIDVQTGELSLEIPGSLPQIAGKIAHWDSLRKEMPGDLEVVPHYFGDSLIITIPGTGQVYHFIDSSLLLKRLDRTFFRGYNFNAHQFVRRDTIFSIGGEGFWHKHSMVTFYDPNHFEWSLYNDQNTNPYSTKDIFSGYSSENDQFFSIHVHSVLMLDSSTLNISFFDFNTRKWTLKGTLDKALQQFIQNNAKTVWTGKYLLLYNDVQRDNVLVLDPFKNEVYVYECPNDHFFLAISEIYAQNGYVYSRDITSSGAPDQKGLDSISIHSIISSTKRIGKIYHNTVSPLIYVIPLFIILIVLMVVLAWKRKRNQKNAPVVLSELELSSVKRFIQDPYKKFTTLEVNALLQIEKKTYDNQRQIRNRVITSINQQCMSVLNKKEMICRSPNEDDKRMMDYYVNPELTQRDLEKVKESLFIV